MHDCGLHLLFGVLFGVDIYRRRFRISLRAGRFAPVAARTKTHGAATAGAPSVRRKFRASCATSANRSQLEIIMNPNTSAAQILASLQPRRPFPGLPRVASAATKRAPIIGQTVTDIQREHHAPIEIANIPSAKIVPINDGKDGAKVVITLNTRYAAHLGDLKAVIAVADAMVARAESMSHGPLKAKTLRALGHPYGRDKEGPRRVPKGYGGKSLVHIKGVRGSVPNLSVINEQTGKLARSWSSEVRKTDSGAVVEIINSTEYSIFLAAGTGRMQAHGPFSFLPATFKGQLLGAWQKEIRAARLRAIGGAV